MSNPREPVSRACMHAGNKNALCQSVLSHELELLEREKTRHMQLIDHEAKQLRERLSDNCHLSDSKAPSTVGSRVGSANRGRECSDRPSSSHGSPGLKPRGLLPSKQSVPETGTDSPETKRKQSTTRAEHVFITTLGSNSLQPVSKAHVGHGAPHEPSSRPAAAGGIPQIVVSDDTGPSSDDHHGRQLERKGSAKRMSSPGSPRSGSDSDSEHPLSQSLNIPYRRARSNSMPMVVLPSIVQPPARRPSYCPAPELSSDLLVPESPRARSTSFSGIVPVRRRGSISERWGSISERNRPVGGRSRGRRGSIDLDNMLRDLTYGVQHRELMAKESRSSVSDKLWEELKQCRYLRIPSRENSEEDVSQESG